MGPLFLLRSIKGIGEAPVETIVNERIQNGPYN